MNDLPRIIINSDDFGSSERVNCEIIELCATKKITSATIMANGKKLRQALDYALTASHISFGLHLNMTEYRPIGPPLSSKLLDINGNFNGDFRGEVNFFDLGNVVNEWSAQWSKLRESGIIVSHIDSHHHIHTHPIVFPALKIFCYTNRIYKIRTTRNIVPREPEKLIERLSKNVAKNFWSFALKYCPPTLITTDYFGSVTDFLKVCESESPNRWRGKTIELMCHPGNTNEKFLSEVTILKKGLRSFINFDFELVSYNEI